VPTDADRRWDASMPQAYERFLVPVVFEPFAIELARRVRALAPSAVLELAAGTGVLTRELVARPDAAAEVVATDLNTPMVELGRERAPEATWRQADAMDLPFDDQTFDVVACQFGVMFFPDGRHAFTEARRVLRASGAFVFNAWDTVASHDFEAALVVALTQVFADDPPTFMTSVPHGYSDPQVITDDLRAAGFANVSIERVTLEGRAASAADLAVGYCTGSPVRAEIEARGDLAATTAAVSELLTASLGDGPLTGRMTAHVVTALMAPPTR
jgi:SAM-dependent methyltransferase